MRRLSALVFSVVTATATCCGLAASAEPAAAGTTQAIASHRVAAATAAAGSWGSAEDVPAPNGGQDAEVLSVSCASAGNCAAGGSYRDSSGAWQAFVVDETGAATVCTITLASGKGSCKLTASQFRPGTHALVAAYPGGSDFTSSASAKKTLTVVK